MNINDFPYEILTQILEEVTKANIRDGPTYTFGLQQAPLPLERAKLQRYVRGPVPPELLKWDATATLRSVCWKWHEWALEHSIKDVYIRRWKGGERWAELSNRRESYPLYELIDRPTGTAVYRDPFASLKRTVSICNDYPAVAAKIRRMWVHGFYTAETDRLVFQSLKNCTNITSLSLPWTAIRHVDAKAWRTVLIGTGKPLQSLELQCVDPTSQQATDKDNLVDLEPLQSVNFSQLRRLKIFGDTSFMPITNNDLFAIARTATQLEEFHLTCNSSITIDGVMAIVKASRKTLRVLEHSPRSQDGFWHPHPGSPSDSSISAILSGTVPSLRLFPSRFLLYAPISSQTTMQSSQATCRYALCTCVSMRMVAPPKRLPTPCRSFLNKPVASSAFAQRVPSLATCTSSSSSQSASSNPVSNPSMAIFPWRRFRPMGTGHKTSTSAARDLTAAPVCTEKKKRRSSSVSTRPTS